MDFNSVHRQIREKGIIGGNNSRFVDVTQIARENKDKIAEGIQQVMLADITAYDKPPRLVERVDAVTARGLRTIYTTYHAGGKVEQDMGIAGKVGSHGRPTQLESKKSRAQQSRLLAAASLALKKM